ncbi:hypothetical protein ACHQM5_013794 [Ranunculus cassubicifolius]
MEERKESIKLEKVFKYGRKKLKQIVTSLKRTTNAPPPRAVQCDELYKETRPCNKNGEEDDPVITAYVLAQNHFSLRPNIYI